jgi:peroxiredoxin
MTATAHAAPEVGKHAPEFTAVDSNGKTVKLSDFRSKTVVLEWTNDGCPYVKKHYGSGNMQSLQKDAAAKGIVWLTIISSAPGKQGMLTVRARMS